MTKASLTIEYAEDAVAAIKYKGEWAFYVGPKDLWLLDHDSWHKSYVDAGYAPFDNGHAERFGIAVVDQSTADEFLGHLTESRYSVEELGEYLQRKRMEDECKEEPVECYPAFLIDFDAKRAISYHPEPFGAEKHVPPGWTGSYYEFLDEIPSALRYWETFKA